MAELKYVREGFRALAKDTGEAFRVIEVASAVFDTSKGRKFCTRVTVEAESGVTISTGAEAFWGTFSVFDGKSPSPTVSDDSTKDAKDVH